MSVYTLEIKLESDTAFSMGAGISGAVDSEVQQDEYGLPFISGRTLKGLLVNECSEILYALGNKDKWQKAAQVLFGKPGDLAGQSQFTVGDAGLAPDLVYHIRRSSLSRQDVLDALTDTRRQTAMTSGGAPKDESLRAIRTLISGITFYAPLDLPADDPVARVLLSACVLSLRRAGLGRNRGKGKVSVKITNRPLVPEQYVVAESKDITDGWFEEFKTEVRK